MIDELYRLNGIDDAAPLNEWIIKQGERAKSQIVVLDNPEQHVDGPTWRWVEFVVRTYTREKNRDGSGRRRRSIFTDLAPSRVDNQLVKDILTELNVPLNPDGSEVVVLETTPPVTTELAQLSEEGDFEADCGSGPVWTGPRQFFGTGGHGWAIKCACAEGFADNGDGKGCQPIPGPPCLVGNFTIDRSVSFLKKTGQLGIVPTECAENQVQG